jgi:hypothetical protein
VQILGATYSDGTQDICLDEMTMAQYHALPQKTTAGQPQYWAHDGQSTVYFYPAPSSQSVTLRTLAAVSDFADLDTDYTMPKGYLSALQAMLAERMAPTVLGDIPQAVARSARAGRLRLKMGIEPEIVYGARTGNVLTGW